MARIRTVKPSFFTDLTIAELPIATRLTFIGLWTHVDDEGRCVDDARLVKAAIWPLDDAYTVRKVEADLALLESKGRIVRYEADGKRCIAVVNWSHQKISHAQPSNLPAPVDDSRSIPGTFSETSVKEPGTFRPYRDREGIGKGVGKECELESSQNLGVAPPEGSSSYNGSPPSGTQLARRLAECCCGDRRVVDTESRRVVKHYLEHVDWRIVDGAIGALSTMPQKPTLPRALARYVSQRVGFPVPEFRP